MTLSSPLRRLPLRTRLVAGFACAILVLLVAGSSFVYWRVEYALDRAIDIELADATHTISQLVTAPGTVASREQADATGVGWQVLSSDGRVLASGGRLAGHAPVPQADLRDAPRTFDLGSMLPISHDALRLRVSRLTSSYLVVAVDRTHRDEALRELLAQLAVTGMGTLLLASLVGDLLARSALRPVERYRAQAANIAAGSSDLRLEVPEERDDEVTRLGHTLNDMLGALEAALDHERQFVNEASHELLTPVTVLTGRIEHARRKKRTAEGYQALLDELAVDAARLTKLTEDLLAIGTRSAGGTCDVVTVIRIIADSQLAAGHRPLAVEVPEGPVVAAVSTTALERIVTNLVSNANKHGRPPVRLVVERHQKYVEVRVTDAGPGMPPELLSRATERFARSDDARSLPGAGLGLALVQQLVGDVGGELRLCFAGNHVSYGSSTDHVCTHDDRFTVTVLLPAPR